MGANSSAPPNRMSTSGEEGGSAGNSPRSASVRSVLGGERAVSSEDLPAIVEYLIRSGQFHFIDGDDSDTESGSETPDCVSPPRPGIMRVQRPPSAELKPPNTATIKKNDIHADILQKSGRLDKKRWQLHTSSATVPNMVFMKQLGLNATQQLTAGERSVLNTRFLPNHMETGAVYNHKAFCGKFSQNGDVFMTACQDQCIRVYSTEHEDASMKLLKQIHARDVGWSVLDAAFSPDGRYAAYSSWSDAIHLCSIQGDYEVHEALQIDPGEHSFCIFSLMFSTDNTEILGGANDGFIYVYDREAGKRSLKIQAHDDDVNTVRFANESSQILYSGGDDGLCKVWDRRTLREEDPQPVGIMAGHSHGVTFIDSKDDGRYFCSNSKDQTLKLWDVRSFSDTASINETRRVVFSQRWDYRWEPAPSRARRKVKGDSSVMTYQGHCIRQTLIRCRFSPDYVTGQRYIYTGCSLGNVVVYDVLTGEIVTKLEGHDNCVRDVDWHPYRNLIMSASWDGSIGQWKHVDLDAHSTEPGETVFETPRPPPGRTRRSHGRGVRPQARRVSKDCAVNRPRSLFD